MTSTFKSSVSTLAMAGLFLALSLVTSLAVLQPAFAAPAANVLAVAATGSHIGRISLQTQTTNPQKSDILHCPSACQGVTQAQMPGSAILASLSAEAAGKPKSDILHCPSACQGVTHAQMPESAILASLSAEAAGKPKSDILHCPSACQGVTHVRAPAVAILASLQTEGSRNQGWKHDHDDGAHISTIRGELG